LWKLTQAGVKFTHIRHCLEQLRAWFPDVEEPLAQLGLLEENGHVLIRLEAGQLAEPSGQQHFDFETQAQPPEPAAPFAQPWRQRGHDLEDAGELEAAALAYRQALLTDGPAAEVCFNLGNVLYRLDRKEQAIERFRQAVELDIEFAEAWNNLGNVLAELEQWQEAVEAYQQALTLNPQYPDAHYNLADTLDQMGRGREAHRSWQSYVRLEPRGQWAEYAKRQLADFDSNSG
jgi:tetratricopeptide (TPR) repeat protein